MDSDRDSRLGDLQRALSLYAGHAEDSPEEIRELLDAHEDLRALLEPMFDSTAIPDPVDVSRTIGDFRLIREIGRGGMGVVYEATELSLDRPVALKVLPMDRTDNPEALLRFRREATSAAGLDHPGIVKVLASGNDGDTHYIAMDFVVGAPLNKIIAALQDQPTVHPDLPSLETAIGSLAHRRASEDTKPEPLEHDAMRGSYIATVVGFVADVADALAHAHARGVVHRDVKPANIMVRRDGSVVLTDFGIARRESQPSLTRTGDTPGTPHYIAPEQVEGLQSGVDHRADIFSLGVTLYEVLTVQRPFVGRTSQQVMNRIVSSEPIHPQKLNSELPADLAAIVLMALEKEPGRRYQTAEDFAADLRAFLAYRPVKARPPGLVRRAQRWAKREPLRASLVALLVLAVPSVTGGLGYWTAIQPALRAGENALHREEIESALTDGFIALKERDPARARSAFRRALARDEKSAEAVAGLALLEQQENPAAALQVFDEFSEFSEDSPPLRRLKAFLLDWSGEHEKASALRDQLGEVGSALDAFVAGISELQLVHEKRPGADSRALELLDLCVLTADRPRPLYHFERAHALGHMKKPAEARIAADAIDQLWPDMTEARFWSAYALCNVDPERSARSIRKALSAAPDRWVFWNNLGVYLRGAGDLLGSRDAYAKSLDLHAENPEALHDLGVVHGSLGDPNSAEDAYRRALTLRPKYVDVWTNLAELHLDSGRLAEAEKSVAGAMRSSPRSAGAQRVLGELRLAEGKVPDAIRLLQRSLAAGLETRTAFQLGRALSRSGDLPGAITAYQKAVDIEPKNAEAHTNLGNLLKRTGNAKDAERHLRLAIAAKPKLSQPNRTLWSLLNTQGRKDELRAHCKDWTTRIPDDPHAWAKSAFTTLWLGPGTREENAIAAMPDAMRAANLSERKNPPILNNVGWVQFYAGDPDAALETLRTGLDLAIQQRLSKRGVQDVIRAAIQKIEASTRK